MFGSVVLGMFVNSWANPHSNTVQSFECLWLLHLHWSTYVFLSPKGEVAICARGLVVWSTILILAAIRYSVWRSCCDAGSSSSGYSFCSMHLRSFWLGKGLRSFVRGANFFIQSFFSHGFHVQVLSTAVESLCCFYCFSGGLSRYSMLFVSSFPWQRRLYPHTLK